MILTERFRGDPYMCIYLICVYKYICDMLEYVTNRMF